MTNKNIDKLDQMATNNRIDFFENELKGHYLAKEKAREFCLKNKGWEMICNIDNVDDYYYTWEELSKKEQKPWIDYYGKLDADKAWREFSYGKCKVENGHIGEDGKFYDRIPMTPVNVMMVFKIGSVKKNGKVHLVDPLEDMKVPKWDINLIAGYHVCKCGYQRKNYSFDKEKVTCKICLRKIKK